MRSIRTALTAAAAVALLTACGGSDEPPTGTEPEPEQSLPPADDGPLTGEQLRDALGAEGAELCQFAHGHDPDRVGNVIAIDQLRVYGEWEQAYAQRYGGCTVLSWDASVDPEFVPSLRDVVDERVQHKEVYALRSEDEGWVLTVEDGLSNTLGYDGMVEDGQRIAELLGRGEPVQPSS